MIDIDKQIGYWKGSGEEDWEAARRLLEGGMVRHGLFFAHLALEKLLKGLVCRQTREIPPRIHNLVRLAELAGLRPDVNQMDLLTLMNAFQMEGRYPEFAAPMPAVAEALKIIRDTEEVLQWLRKQY